MYIDVLKTSSRIIDERYAIEGLRIEIFGSVAGLHPGASFSFVHPGYAQYSGDYLVMSLSHTLIQQAAIEHDSDLGNLAYTHHASWGKLRHASGGGYLLSRPNDIYALTQILRYHSRVL